MQPGQRIGKSCAVAAFSYSADMHRVIIAHMYRLFNLTSSFFMTKFSDLSGIRMFHRVFSSGNKYIVGTRHIGLPPLSLRTCRHI